jgi:hypothetical protein
MGAEVDLLVLLNKDVADKTSEEADKTLKEVDKVSTEMGLSLNEAGRKGWWRGRGMRGEEEKEGVSTPSSRENQFRKTMEILGERTKNFWRASP